MILDKKSASELAEKLPVATGAVVVTGGAVVVTGGAVVVTGAAVVVVARGAVVVVAGTAVVVVTGRVVAVTGRVVAVTGAAEVVVTGGAVVVTGTAVVVGEPTPERDSVVVVMIAALTVPPGTIVGRRLEAGDVIARVVVRGELVFPATSIEESSTTTGGAIAVLAA